MLGIKSGDESFRLNCSCGAPDMALKERDVLRQFFLARADAAEREARAQRDPESANHYRAIARTWRYLVHLTDEDGKAGKITP